MAGPPSEASLHALATKAVEDFDKCRWARAADLYKRAALQASTLLPLDSLITAELQYCQAAALHGQANQPGVSVAEKRELYEQAWELVREGMEVVSRRCTSDTLGYNKCRPDEVQYMTRHIASCLPAGVDAAHRAQLMELATPNAMCTGVSVALRLARLCLYRLHSRIYGIALPLLARPYGAVCFTSTGFSCFNTCYEILNRWRS